MMTPSMTEAMTMGSGVDANTWKEGERQRKYERPPEQYVRRAGVS